MTTALLGDSVTVRTAHWTAYAKCDGVDPAIFFPRQGEPLDEARRICNACPVQKDCLEHTLVNGERFGVWGGTSERERRRLRRERRERRPRHHAA